MRAEQLVQSLRSLRRYNARVVVYLVLYDPVPEHMLREAERWGVRVVQAEEYGAMLQRSHGFGYVLAELPTLHKLFSLRSLPLGEASQILYLDADTFFFGDVENLFEGNLSAHWFAREEPYSGRSGLGYDPAYLDERVLDEIVRGEGLGWVGPCNTGVVLLNYGVWWRLLELEGEFLDFALRLTLGVQLREGLAGGLEGAAVLEAAGAEEVRRALPYPSGNAWILDEVAVWLMLGRVPGFIQGFFAADQVMQGDEPVRAGALRGECVVAHYFSNCMAEFFAAVPRIP